MTIYQTAIFFDLDGTLIFNTFERAVWPTLLGELATKTGQPAIALLDLIEAENDARQRDSSTAAVHIMDWDDITQTIAGRLGVTLEANCEALMRANAAAVGEVLDGGEAILRELDAPHRALVVATKGLLKYQQPVLDALGLTHFFTDILTPDIHGALKRSRAFFGDWPRAARLCIMVGDRYADDVEMQGSFGFKTIWKRPDLSAALQKKDPFTRALLHEYDAGQSVTPDAIITSLAELPAVVRRLEQSFLGFSD